MRNARTQYDVAVNFVGHLAHEINKNATAEEMDRFRDVMVPFLDVLADLLNNPRIAQAWEDLPDDGSQMIKALNASRRRE